jgi:hypothetical protein
MHILDKIVIFADLLHDTPAQKCADDFRFTILSIGIRRNLLRILRRCHSNCRRIARCTSPSIADRRA